MHVSLPSEAASVPWAREGYWRGHRTRRPETQTGDGMTRGRDRRDGHGSDGRAPGRGGSLIQRRALEPGKRTATERLPPRDDLAVQRNAPADVPPAADADDNIRRARGGGGAPLPSTLSEELARCFGDISGVRVHTGTDSAEAAR